MNTFAVELRVTVMSNYLLLFCLFLLSCGNALPVAEGADSVPQEEAVPTKPPVEKLQVAAELIEDYLPLLEGKKTALVVNQTSTLGSTHLVDTLVSLGIDVETIFAPEHGFRGQADAGEDVKDGKDIKTGIQILSLHGKSKKPSEENLAGIEVVVFDIQDVGARFYTYISTMSYVMEACAEQGIPFIVLDRPNPNGHYVDGPVLEPAYSSFVGLHTIPVVHGMTIGEYARMVNEEGWLKQGVQVNLKVIKCKGYDHEKFYELPIKPSPNLPNMRSIYLYPSTCFFEGTIANEGRGTNKQFQVFGAPKFTAGSYNYTPKSMPGAKYPKHKGVNCNGYDLSGLELIYLQKQSKINLSYLLEFYRDYPDKENFFNKDKFFDTLAGTDKLRKSIIAGKTEKEIRAEWQEDLAAFKKIRAKYLLY